MDEPPDVQIRLIARALMGDITSYRDQVAVFLHEWRVSESHPEWHGICNARKEFEDIITAILERGRHDGLFAIGDVRLTLFARLLGMLNYPYQWYDPRGRTRPDQVADHLRGRLLAGYLRPRVSIAGGLTVARRSAQAPSSCPLRAATVLRLRGPASVSAFARPMPRQPTGPAAAVWVGRAWIRWAWRRSPGEPRSW